MKKLFSVLVSLLALVSFFPLYSQVVIPNSSITGKCFAGEKVKRIFIPPPDSFLKKSASKRGGSVTIYCTGFSAAGENAMKYAASILETMLPPDTKMTVLASWIKITETGVLGNSSVTGYVGGWGINALNPRAYYPVSLAEKIAGESLNTDSEGDFVININKSINWYLGTDGNTPSDAYDLVSVVLHEICHGLGFFDSMYTTSKRAYYGFPATVTTDDSVVIINDTIPMIYDTFLESAGGMRLTDTLQFANNSSALFNQVTGGQVYFNGILLNNYTPGNRARIYAPSTFSLGSSISHLDENSYSDSCTLMTPYIDKAEAIHDPGKFIFSILGDIGWINTRIYHKPPEDTEEHLSEVGLEIAVKSDTVFDRNKVGVVYSFNRFETSDTLYMNSANSDDTFNIVLSLPAYNTELKYYFFVKDCFSRLYRSPSLYEDVKYTVFVGADTVKPVISHKPVSYYLQSVDSISFTATITDNNGVDSAWVEYIVNNNAPKFIGLKAGDEDVYRTIFNAENELLKGGDSIRYRIFAIDSALIHNTAVLPKTGYFVINIEKIESVLLRYSTDFSDSESDFITDGFNITQPENFNSKGLHSKHPYESPGVNDDSIEYFAILRHPLKFNSSGMLIDYKEVVLVEPGEEGSLYGSSSFYDYVVLEGSTDFGHTWFGMEDGYDSRYLSSWEFAYNSSIEGNNSTFEGQESMMQKHSLFYHPSDDLADGDALMLRFRLYSDPFANGWGWAIDDLNISCLVDAVEKVNYEQVKVYPNPGKGHITISSDLTENGTGRPQKYSVFNSSGVSILNGFTSGDSETVIDISGSAPGFYIIMLFNINGIETFKYNLVK